MVPRPGVAGLGLATWLQLPRFCYPGTRILVGGRLPRHGLPPAAGLATPPGAPVGAAGRGGRVGCPGWTGGGGVVPAAARVTGPAAPRSRWRTCTAPAGVGPRGGRDRTVFVRPIRPAPRGSSSRTRSSPARVRRRYGPASPPEGVCGDIDWLRVSLRSPRGDTV